MLEIKLASSDKCVSPSDPAGEVRLGGTLQWLGSEHYGGLGFQGTT